MKKNKFKYLTITFFLLTLLSINSKIYGVKENNDYLNVNVKSAVVIDNETKRVLYNKNAYDQRAVASLTKMMTSIILVENCDINEIITVPKSVANIGGTTIGLKAGDKIKAKDLLIGMLLPSRK